MSTTKASARLRILHALKRTGGLTAPEIARELGITSMGVRKHLTSLSSEGMISQSIRSGARGRPAVVYAVSPSGEALFPQGYRQLAVDLLQDLATIEGEQKLDRLFELRNERLARTFQVRFSGKPFAERVKELARARDDDGYMTTLEQTGDGFILAEHNCPIYDVAQRFTRACNCEHELFEQVLDADVKRETTLVDGASECRYHISER